MSRHLMAKFRHLQAADEHGLDFDWRENEAKFPHSRRTNLENGDHLMTHGFGWPNSPTGMAWGYYLFGPRQHHDQNPTQDTGPIFHRYSDDPEGTYSETLGLGTTGPNGMFTTHDEAAKAAEQHYKTLDRRGVTPPARDYDINQIMRDEGF